MLLCVLPLYSSIHTAHEPDPLTALNGCLSLFARSCLHAEGEFVLSLIAGREHMDLEKAAAAAVMTALKESPSGDVLVFLPGVITKALMNARVTACDNAINATFNRMRAFYSTSLHVSPNKTMAKMFLNHFIAFLSQFIFRQ